MWRVIDTSGAPLCGSELARESSNSRASSLLRLQGRHASKLMWHRTSAHSDICRPKYYVACDQRTCALRAPTVFSERMKSASVQKTRLLLTPNTAGGFF